jgi:hypothetical protein
MLRNAAPALQVRSRSAPPVAIVGTAARDWKEPCCSFVGYRTFSYNLVLSAFNDSDACTWACNSLLNESRSASRIRSERVTIALRHDNGDGDHRRPFGALARTSVGWRSQWGGAFGSRILEVAVLPMALYVHRLRPDLGVPGYNRPFQILSRTTLIF